MPQATDLVIKNGASTPVDKTFKLLAPAAGYDSVAEWALKEGAISSVFPTLTALVRKGNPVPGRSPSKIAKFKVRTPSSYTDTVTGLTNVASAFEMNVDISIPADFPETLKADAVAYCVNFLNTSLVKAMLTEGAPAT